VGGDGRHTLVEAAFLDRGLLEKWDPTWASHLVCQVDFDFREVGCVPDPGEGSYDKVLHDKLEP